MSVTSSAKSFDISKRDVWDAYKRIKANRGAAGVDGQSITKFEEHLSANLYKLWNRLASGSYFPDLDAIGRAAPSILDVLARLIR
jgi:RNA-directed DNA polymerase